MNGMVVKSKVSSDGILHLRLAVGLEEADKEVQVTVESAAPKKAMTPEEWRAWVESMAGTWQGDFERPPQGVYEEREPRLAPALSPWYDDRKGVSHDRTE